MAAPSPSTSPVRARSVPLAAVVAVVDTPDTAAAAAAVEIATAVEIVIDLWFGGFDIRKRPVLHRALTF